MTLTEAKRKIDLSGEAFLTLTNEAEYAFIGQVDKMTTKEGRVKLIWKLPAAEHVSAFNKAAIHGSKATVYWAEDISPLRLDNGTKKFEIDWDL